MYTSGYSRLMTMLDFDKAINVVLGVSYAIVTQMIACIVSLLERAQVCALVCISSIITKQTVCLFRVV
jgi:hypothetical protein